MPRLGHLTLASAGARRQPDTWLLSAVKGRCRRWWSAVRPARPRGGVPGAWHHRPQQRADRGPCAGRWPGGAAGMESALTGQFGAALPRCANGRRSPGSENYVKRHLGVFNCVKPAGCGQDRMRLVYVDWLAFQRRRPPIDRRAAVIEACRLKSAAGTRKARQSAIYGAVLRVAVPPLSAPRTPGRCAIRKPQGFQRSICRDSAGARCRMPHFPTCSGLLLRRPSKSAPPRGR